MTVIARRNDGWKSASLDCRVSVLLGANPRFGMKNAPMQMPRRRRILKNQNLIAEGNRAAHRWIGLWVSPILYATSRIFRVLHAQHQKHHGEEETRKRELYPVHAQIANHRVTR